MSYKCKKCEIVVGDRHTAPSCSVSSNGQHEWRQIEFSNDTKWSESLVGKLFNAGFTSLKNGIENDMASNVKEYNFNDRGNLEEGDLVDLPDGDYPFANGQSMLVKNGKITSIGW